MALNRTPFDSGAPLGAVPHPLPQTMEEMREALGRKVPAKIDIGPVYTVNPQDRLKFGGGRGPGEGGRGVGQAMGPQGECACGVGGGMHCAKQGGRKHRRLLPKLG